MIVLDALVGTPASYAKKQGDLVTADIATLIATAVPSLFKGLPCRRSRRRPGRAAASCARRVRGGHVAGVDLVEVAPASTASSSRSSPMVSSKPDGTAAARASSGQEVGDTTPERRRDERRWAAGSRLSRPRSAAGASSPVVAAVPGPR